MGETKTKVLGSKDVLAALERLVQRHGPDTRYVERDPIYADTQVCRNVDEEGRPLCIVGTLLVEEFGISGSTFFERSVEGSGVDGLLDDLPEFTELLDDNEWSEVRNVLLVAQNAQDRGRSWGDALSSARLEVR